MVRRKEAESIEVMRLNDGLRHRIKVYEEFIQSQD